MATNSLATDPAEVLPRPGMTGSWLLAVPYTTSVNPNVEYSCTSVKTINSLIAEGVDVKALYYTPYGLGETEYQADVALNHCIIGIQAITGKTVSFPSSYLLGFPNANAVVYSCLILSIALSPIPESMNLTSLKADIADLVLSRTGIKNEVKIANHSAPHLVSQAKHTLLEAARLARITAAKPMVGQIQALQQEVLNLQQQNAVLAAYIAANVTP